MIFGRIEDWQRLLRLGLMAAGLLVSSARADTPGAAFSADAVKAAYLVNFIRFTEWPASALGSADAPFVIGVAGNRDLEDYLWKITDGKRLHGRNVRVLRLAIPSDAATCQLIYINPSPSRTDAVAVSVQEWLQAVRDKPVLTVSSEASFIKYGGIINFYTDGNNLRFEIAPETAAASGLSLSSRLLSIARIVHTRPRHLAPEP